MNCTFLLWQYCFWSSAFCTWYSVRFRFMLSFWLSQGPRRSISVQSIVFSSWEPMSVISFLLWKQKLLYIYWESYPFSLDGYWIGIWLYPPFHPDCWEAERQTCGLCLKEFMRPMVCTASLPLSYFYYFPFSSNFHIYLFFYFVLDAYL